MPKTWRLYPHDPDRVSHLARGAGVSAVVAQLLVCRGFTDPGLARDFLDVRLSQLREPQLLPGVETAAALLADAVKAGRKIVVYGDYDVDGMTATSILWLCLKSLGATASYYVPHRVDEGYGLNDEALRRLAQQGADVVVTVDCGIASVAEAETARQLGLQLIITDHHELADRLPEAAAIVHPRLPGSSYPFGGLSGAGVAFKLAWALCQQVCGARKVNDRLREFLLSAVGLAALGTVADVVPLVDENRVLVQYGLSSLKQQSSAGLAALLKVTGLDGKQSLECEDIGFQLAPRLNAAGRFGQALLGVELLTTGSAERAQALAEYVNELNGSRQSLERSIYLAANKQIQEQFDPDADPALVLAGEDWHAGVIGIVAGRLAEKHHRPVVMLSIDPLGSRPCIGSARSVPGFDLHQALAACGQHLVSHGGHAAAAGLKITADKIDLFRDEFCEYAAAEISHDARRAELWIDAEVPLGALTLDTVQQIERLAPFGQSNPRPLFCATGVQLDGPPKKIGGGERHLALRLKQANCGLRGVSFGNGEWADELARVDGALDIAFRPVINHFRGQRSVELHVADWRRSGGGVA